LLAAVSAEARNPSPSSPVAGGPPPADGEFERQPVPTSHLRRSSDFIGMYAGEHVAGTEFMIGPLFVARGARAFDIIVGLLLGNLLAVLSWRFLCTPIATRARLTLYFQLEKICGANLVNVYNLANGVMFCFLAGAMVAVSATAVGVPFGLPMPGLDDWLPNGPGWIVAVFGVGAVIAIVAARGYNAVARFSNFAAPWMVVVFIACGLMTLPALGIHSPADFWEVARDRMWTGNVQPGQSPLSFWNLVFFAWFANMAMHVGMADLSIFRFARRPSAGWASACGMFVGHYLAWIAAALLYTLQLQRDPGNTAVAPGPMAYDAAGFAGIVCVLVAGWTTANPTIYRAGLAFQSLFPRWSRFRVTILAGAVATLGGCFPALVMKLLDFVALYGLILMPMGAVIFIDFWIFPRLGLKQYWAESTHSRFNAAAGVAWIATLIVCAALTLFGGVEIFFVALPGWFLAAVLYVVAGKVVQRRGQVVST
jgi:purine-cytosine permease-like protein